MNNLIFVSGPHGSGKTTLINNIVERIPHAISPELKTKTPELYWGDDKKIMRMNYHHRQALKYAKRAFEGYEYFMTAKKNPNNLIIGDRCIYDCHVYNAVEVSLGWLPKSDVEEQLQLLHLDELLEPKCIVLNPGFDVCKTQLEKRNKETGWIKYKGEDMGYLRAICDAFKEFKDRNVLYIETADDLNPVEENITNFLSKSN